MSCHQVPAPSLCVPGSSNPAETEEVASPRPVEGGLRAQLTPALPVLGSHGDPGSVPASLCHPSALCSAGAVKQKGAASEKPSAPHLFLGKGAAPPSLTCVCGVTLQCRTVLPPVPQCGLKGLGAG